MPSYNYQLLQENVSLCTGLFKLLLFEVFTEYDMTVTVRTDQIGLSFALKSKSNRPTLLEMKIQCSYMQWVVYVH